MLTTTPVSIQGIQIATTSVGFKQKERDDLLVFFLSENTQVAWVSTTSRFKAPCIQILEERISKPIRALVVNSGNANAATGELGYQNALESCEIVASHLNVSPESVLPFSTGVIGEHLPVDLFRKGVSQFIYSNTSQAWIAAAIAIKTTDTVEKHFSYVFPNSDWVITGIAKGSGMIFPNMATMLSYVATNVAIDQLELSSMIRRVVRESFNRITVDGDESTNDAFVLMATGESEYLLLDENRQLFYEGLKIVCENLAKAIVKDGEGATKLVKIEVLNAIDEKQARATCISLANSPLIKTMLYAEDPNFGRLCMAVGKVSDDRIHQHLVDIWLNKVCVIKGGVVDSEYTEEQGYSVMQQPEYTISVDLHLGDINDHIWTCDYSYDYIRINAEYRS